MQENFVALSLVRWWFGRTAHDTGLSGRFGLDWIKEGQSLLLTAGRGCHVEVLEQELNLLACRCRNAKNKN